jgi:prepilin-type N-terminal cleavage/methylation domain-containing protein
MRREAFTLVEILVGILIFSLIIIGGFQAFSSVTVGKVRLIHQANTQKQIIYFSQRLFEEVKNG